jgi:hypothetical protein
MPSAGIRQSPLHPNRTNLLPYRLMPLTLRLVVPLLLLLSVAAIAQSPTPLTITFAGNDYLHRWSRGGQHEFTPKGQEDLTKWTTMVTVNVYESARTGEQLAEIANKVLGLYQQSGKMVRTDSKPRTDKSEAEHLAVAVLGTPEFLEAVFARFLVHDGRGLSVVHSKRVYGAKAGNEMSAWLEKNGPDTESALMAWTGIPRLAALRALPQSPQE